MDKDRRRALDILIDVLTTLEPRVLRLKPWINQIAETTEKWFSSEGNQGVKRMKDILHKGLLAIFKEDLGEPLSFVKAKKGIPILALPFVEGISRFTPDVRLMSAAVTIARLPDLWLGLDNEATITKTLSVIKDSTLKGTARKVIDEFSNEFIPAFFKQFPDHPAVKAWNETCLLSDSHTYLYRESKGPNGFLIGNAHLDVMSCGTFLCTTGRTLLEEIKNLGNLVAQASVSGTQMYFDSAFADTLLEHQDLWSKFHYSSCPGKLSLKSEKGGKVRLVAQPDYYTQVVMHPLHDWLMGVLRKLPQDHTFDQKAAIPKIGKWQDEGRWMYSFDQSSCTDLFPFEFQLELIRHRFGTPMMEAFRTVVADRDWIISMKDGSTRKVRWHVGQPLGMFGSWPLMALSHHLLVQYCAWLYQGKRFGKKPFERYVICGDDIVIADRGVARRYLKVVDLLGMKVNLSKSHITGGNSNIPVSEFAKVIVWKGRPLFPLRPNMVLKMVQDVRHAVPFVVDLVGSETWTKRLAFFERLIKKYFPREKRFLTTLLTIPREFGGMGFRDDRSLRSLLMDEFDLKQIHPYVYYLASRIRTRLKLEQATLGGLESLREITLLPDDAFRLHPYVEFLRRTGQEHRSFREATSTGIPSISSIAAEIVMDGLGAYRRFLKPDDRAVVMPLRKKKMALLNQKYTDREQDLLRERSVWMKALTKSHQWPREFSRGGLIPGLEAFIHGEDPRMRYAETPEEVLKAKIASLLQSAIFELESKTSD